MKINIILGKIRVYTKVFIPKIDMLPIGNLPTEHH